MSPEPFSSAPDAEIAQQAAAWLARRDRGLTAGEQDEFFQWLADDPRHGEWLARHQRTVSGLKLLAQWQPEHGSRPNPDLLAPPSPIASHRRSSAHRLWLTLAAAASLAVVFWWQQHPVPETPLAAFVETPPIVRKILEDGSTIDLNRGAEVEVNYSSARRDVRLVRGEASFSVAKNPERPFVVNAGGVEVRAVGTAFNVKFQPKSVAVLVTEGKVRVDNKGNATGPASLPETERSAHETSVYLEKGQRTVVSLAELTQPKVETVPPGEMAHALAWQPRQLEFNDTPLAQVVAEFNANNQVKMVVDDPQLASVPIGASLRSDNVEGFIRVLEASFHVRTERRADGVIVLRPAD